MPLQIIDHGKNNSVEISERLVQAGKGSITLRGDDNRVKIEDTEYNLGINLNMAGQCSLSIGHQVNCSKLFVHMAMQAEVTIGEWGSFNDSVRLLLHERGRIAIGSGCLIADQVDISISDMHSIVDATTRQRLNPAQDIFIGSRVWIGQRAMIMKGVKIGSGSVIGSGSIVTRDIPDNCVAAGNPARVVRDNATWDFRLI